MRLAELHGEDLDGDDGPNRSEAVPVIEEAVSDVRPVTARSRVGKR